MEKKPFIDPKYRMQLMFGLPILWLAIAAILLDSFGIINVEKFGYAFFGGIVIYFQQFFFRKKAPDEPVNGETPVKPVVPTEPIVPPP